MMQGQRPVSCLPIIIALFALVITYLMFWFIPIIKDALGIT